jgi:hypothetical protein
MVASPTVDDTMVTPLGAPLRSADVLDASTWYGLLR